MIVDRQKDIRVISFITTDSRDRCGRRHVVKNIVGRFVLEMLVQVAKQDKFVTQFTPDRNPDDAEILLPGFSGREFTLFVESTGESRG